MSIYIQPEKTALMPKKSASPKKIFSLPYFVRQYNILSCRLLFERFSRSFFRKFQRDASDFAGPELIEQHSRST